MFRSLSDSMRRSVLGTLYKRYDELNKKLNRDFLRMYYEDWEIEDMREQLKAIEELIKEFKED
jgi:hypothetical protein